MCLGSSREVVNGLLLMVLWVIGAKPATLLSEPPLPPKKNNYHNKRPSPLHTQGRGGGVGLCNIFSGREWGGSLLVYHNEGEVECEGEFGGQRG